MATGMFGEAAGAQGVDVVSRVGPRSAPLWLHARRRPYRVPATSPANATSARVLEVPTGKAQPALYVSSRWVASHRRESRARMVRQLWALRILTAAWTLGIGVTGWIAVDLVGWEFALCTQAPMLVLLAVLAVATRRASRWLRTQRGD